jgi:hypothetical protein
MSKDFVESVEGCARALGSGSICRDLTLMRCSPPPRSMRNSSSKGGPKHPSKLLARRSASRPESGGNAAGVFRPLQARKKHVSAAQLIETMKKNAIDIASTTPPTPNGRRSECSPARRRRSRRSWRACPQNNRCWHRRIPRTSCCRKQPRTNRRNRTSSDDDHRPSFVERSPDSVCESFSAIKAPRYLLPTAVALCLLACLLW